MRDCPVPALDQHAELTLKFERAGAATRLALNRHHGPLRVQKPLYPEGEAVCHAIVVHPPGGVVGGDSLCIRADCGAGAHALLTSPGAAKWYRADGKPARQDLHLRAAAGAKLEWLPQETILFDAADVSLCQTVDLEDDARYLGLDILCFGRRAAGETFKQGRLHQRLQITQGGKLLWWEQGRVHASALSSPFVLGGASVCATLIAAGATLPPGVLAEVRAAGLHASQVKTVFVARHLGQDSERARQLMHAAWQLVRPALLGQPGALPRIWQT